MENINYPKGIVPLDIARKMKILGFREPCIFFYREKGMCVCLNTNDTKISGVADYYRVCHIKYNNIEEYDSNQQEDYISLPDYETAYNWFRSFDFIEDFFIRKKEDSSDYICELVLKIKPLEGESYYKKKLIEGIKEVKNELLKKLCDFVYYYTKIKK
jgi:hypothetical protein